MKKKHEVIQCPFCKNYLMTDKIWEKLDNFQSILLAIHSDKINVKEVRCSQCRNAPEIIPKQEGPGF